MLSKGRTRFNGEIHAVRLGAHETETQIVVPVVRVVVVPVRGTDVLSRIVPAPAAIHAVRPRGRALEGKPSLQYIIAEITGTRKQQVGKVSYRLIRAMEV